MTVSLPVLYSFRRCPYAIRARLALAHCQVDCEVREVELRNKPVAMLAVSPKATVPVLVLDGGARIIEESLDVMRWAVTQLPSSQMNTAAHHLDVTELEHDLVQENDHEFKSNLDRYKYFDRYPEQSQDAYWEAIKPFFEKLESSLVIGVEGKAYLLHPKASLIDWAIFPFVRQCFYVDPQRFDELELPLLMTWLKAGLESDVFRHLMAKHPFWYDSSDTTYSLLND